MEVQVQTVRAKCIDYCRHPVFYDYLCRLESGDVVRLYARHFGVERAWWFSDPTYAKTYFDFNWNDFDAYGEDVEIKLCKRGDMVAMTANVTPNRVFVFRELAKYKEYSVGKRLTLGYVLEEDANVMFGKFARDVLELVRACYKEGS